MAVKVLIDGKEKTFRIDCPFCLSRLEYKNNDCKTKTEEKVSRSVEISYIICPVCNEELLISKGLKKKSDKDNKKEKGEK